MNIKLKRGYDIKITEPQEDTTDIDVVGCYAKSNYQGSAIVGIGGVSPTVRENHGQVTGIVIQRERERVVIPEATKQGYTYGYEGDCIYVNRPQQKRGVCQKGMTQTLKTSIDDLGVIVKETENYIEWDGKGYEQCRRATKEDKIATTTTTKPSYSKVLQNNLRIRKLTPKEVGRLQGLKDSDIDKISAANSTQYHLYGDSICISVLEAIFGTLCDVDWEKEIKERLKVYKDNV